MAESFKDQTPFARSPSAVRGFGPLRSFSSMQIQLRGIAISLLMVAALTAALFSTRATLLQDVRLDQVTMIYLISGAVRRDPWGLGPGRDRRGRQHRRDRILLLSADLRFPRSSDRVT